MKRMLVVLLVLCLSFGVCACASAPGDPETSVDGKVTYRVNIVDEANKPMPDVMVQLCKDSCYPGMTNQEGIAEFHLAEADYKASVTVMPEGYSAEAEEFCFGDGSYELTITLTPVS